MSTLMQELLIQAPKHIQDFLMRFGGWNPYKRPNYRVALAQSVFVKEGGVFLIWPEGSTLAERGGVVYSTNEHNEPVAIQSPLKPLRTETGTKTCAKYPGLEGWILEKWYPASFYGSPTTWYAQALDDGTPLLGPYPHEGEYEMVAGPSVEVPNESELRRIIMFIESQVANRKGTPEQRLRERIDRIREQNDKAEAAARRDNFLRLREESRFISSSTPEAGRLREEVAKRIRAKGGKIGHVGN